jgi:hypothetical protein
MKKMAKSRQRKVRHVWVRQLLLMLSVIGPGLKSKAVPKGTVAQVYDMCYAT